MRDRVARLRFWLAGSALLLLTVIIGFIGYGRYVSHLRHLKLPLPPGVNIVREAGGWTFSRANGSKTLYTIHAAGFQQGKNGKMALRDVSVVLFGKDGDRNDRVYGQDFEYDQKEGVIRALGTVHIDLQSAEAAKAIGQEGQTSVVKRPNGEEALGSDVIHVTTSGLVYLEKLGIAATSDAVDVQAGNLKGHAKGADYSSDSGMLMLHSAVDMAGNSGGHQVHITAAQAQFDQKTQKAKLTDATYQSDGRSVAASSAVLHRRTNGTLDKVDAEGNVRLRAGDAQAVARRATLQMDAKGEPGSALLNDDVVYTANEPLRQVRAEAGMVQVSFAGGAKREPEHAVFSGAVQMAERIRPDQRSQRWSSRELKAGKVETWMSAGPDGRMQLQNAVATGTATLVATTDPTGPKTNAPVRTELGADELKGTMRLADNRSFLDEIVGNGNTSLLQVSAAGVEQASTGDTLKVKFRTAGGKAVKGKQDGAALTQIAGSPASAVQQGHVTMTRTVPGKHKGEAAEVQHGTSDQAVYEGDADQVVLTGAVRLDDTSGALWAQQVVLERASGNAHASGPVKAEYVQQESRAGSPRSEPMHVLAERADLNKVSDTVIFYGRPARVWQGGNQVQAPEVQLERTAKRMIAGAGGGAAPNGSAVRTILANATSTGTVGSQRTPAGNSARCGTPTAGGTQAGQARQSEPGVVKIDSGGLVYSGTLNQASFTGGVRAETLDGTVRATEGTAFLAKRAGKGGVAMSLQGGVEQIVAEGQVGLTRPGTHVSGERLVYETATRNLVLSGGKEPAKAVDGRGTTTAAAFRFNACDNTLEALGEAPGVPPRKVETETVAAGAKQEKAGR